MRAREFAQPPAAGCVLYAEDTGRWGFQQRSDSVTDPGVWSTWGGGREPGETLTQCVRRELAEESGYHGEVVLEPMGSNSDYATFVARVPREFEPRPNAEVKSWCWVDPGDWPKPMHPDLARMLSENFADGKKPGRKGLAKRMGVPTGASVSKLRQIAKSSTGEKRRMAHWMANMKSGRQRADEGAVEDLEKDLRHPLSYDAIDNMMQSISRRHGISANELHDLFVEKHGKIPDTWIQDQTRGKKSK